MKRIREKALKQYPFLEKWGTDDFGWPDLMFIESQAMIGAMSELMRQGIPSLAVHDSLLVPASKQEFAERALSEHYLKETGAVPVLRREYPRPSEPAMRLPSEISYTSSPEEWNEGMDEFSVAKSEEENDRGDDEDVDHDPLGLNQSEEGDAGEYDQALTERAKDDGDWPSDEEEDRGDEEYPSLKSTADDSYNKYGTSDYF